MQLFLQIALVSLILWRAIYFISEINKSKLATKGTHHASNKSNWS